jgi:Zn-dependent protease
VRGTIPLGRISGIPIGLHWSALIGVGLLTQLLGSTVLPMLAPAADGPHRWLAAALAAIALVASLLAHELAHSIAAQRSGLRVRHITLWLLGGVSELADPPPNPSTEIRVALVGPVTSLLLGAVCMYAASLGQDFGPPGLAVGTLSWLAVTNLILALFNLLPGTPLDGGRVMHALWWRHTGNRTRATRAASASGRTLGALLAGIGTLLVLTGRLDGLWLALIGWFLAGSAVAEQRTSATSTALHGVHPADVMSTPATVVPARWTMQTMLTRLTEGGLRHRAYPVTDPDGRPIGLITLPDLARCPHNERATTTVGQLARPLPEERTIAADATLDPLLHHPPRAGELIVVRDGDQLAGVISRSDLIRAAEVAGLTTTEEADTLR